MSFWISASNVVLATQVFGSRILVYLGQFVKQTLRGSLALVTSINVD